MNDFNNFDLGNDESALMNPDVALAIGSEQLKVFTKELQKYKAGKSAVERRILSSEQWWKLRNAAEEVRDDSKGDSFHSVSGWLHNVITSKHADAMAAYPTPNILPREKNDREEARILSSILPCVLEQNKFEKTYNDEQWQKLKTGTGCYKIVWDHTKLGGLGDITIEKVNLLNIYWEPTVSDIQKSRYIFHTELADKEYIEQAYPQAKGKINGKGFTSTRFLYDEHADTSDKHTIIDVYYHKYINGKKTLQYCKYVGDVVLYATENIPELAERGLYDHAKYPYVFDPLFPIEGSPCGYGYVDLCKNPQTEIDLLKTSFVENALVGSKPRYFKSAGATIKDEEFLDLDKPLVEVGGALNEHSLMPITHKSLDGVYINVLNMTIEELRETSGNTETSTGSTSSGVTAASAIAALQEASGKGSRDSTQGSYRAYAEIIELCIELIRQFYDMPRKFRITGQYGEERFITYTNNGIQPQHQGMDFGEDQGFRLPVFDVMISAEKKSTYTKVSQNELALQFFQLGFFNPQMSNQALMCLDIMEFDGKDIIMQKISQNGTLMQKLVQYMQMCIGLAKVANPALLPAIAQDYQMLTGQPLAMGGGTKAELPESDNIAGIKSEEHPRVANARERASEASQPS